MPTVAKHAISHLCLIMWMQKEIKKYMYSWEACAGNLEQLGVLNSYEYLHDTGGDLCKFLDLLMGPLSFVIFHTS
jgi:hypothetical protein